MIWVLGGTVAATRSCEPGRVEPYSLLARAATAGVVTRLTSVVIATVSCVPLPVGV